MKTENRHPSLFITGACGFTGNYVVREFIEAGSFVLHLNCRHGKPDLAGPDITYHQVDLTNRQQVEEFFHAQRIDTIIHLSALARVAEGERSPKAAYRSNFLVTRQLFEAALQFNITRFVFISSDLVRNPRSVVGITKYLSEYDILHAPASRMKRIILRLPNLSWTPGSVHLIFARLLEENQPITITHPDMSRRFISGEEAAKYVRYVLENGKDKDIFVVNKPTEKITDLARQMMKEKGTNVDLKFIGMRPGEKLVEEPYEENETTPVSFDDLALWNDKPAKTAERNKLLAMLEKKSGIQTEENN
ncbi:MAG: polysaccharide biosynthesis protein [bacterium]